METVRIRDPEWKKSRIRDKHPGSATLIGTGTKKIKNVLGVAAVLFCTLTIC